MKTEINTKKPKPNKLDKLVLNITEPMKMDQELELAQLAVFVGQNNTGKSFLLKVAFALGAIGQIRTVAPGPNSFAQFVFDSTFVDQKFDGLFKAIYTMGSVSVEIKEGRVAAVDAQGETTPVTYMSSDMRTFDQMTTYLRIRKSAGDNPLVFMQKMLEAYRLYDVTYMEGFLIKLPLLLPDRVKQHLEGFGFREPIVSIEADLDKCEFLAVLKDGTKKNISTYGKGHQSILNMALGATT